MWMNNWYWARRKIYCSSRLGFCPTTCRNCGKSKVSVCVSSQFCGAVLFWGFSASFHYSSSSFILCMWPKDQHGTTLLTYIYIYMCYVYTYRRIYHVHGMYLFLLISFCSSKIFEKPSRNVQLRKKQKTKKPSNVVLIYILYLFSTSSSNLFFYCSRWAMSQNRNETYEQ